MAIVMANTKPRCIRLFDCGFKFIYIVKGDKNRYIFKPQQLIR